MRRRNRSWKRNSTYVSSLLSCLPRPHKNGRQNLERKLVTLSPSAFTTTVKCTSALFFTVSADGDDFDRYAAYLCPTIEDGYALQADFAKIAEESGFVASK